MYKKNQNKLTVKKFKQIKILLIKNTNTVITWRYTTNKVRYLHGHN